MRRHQTTRDLQQRVSYGRGHDHGSGASLTCNNTWS
jgi:hypothetical protein